MFRILKKDDATRARVGILETPHGAVETPAYVVVGTHAKVRALDADDLKNTGIQLIIANTYHLWQTLGEEGLKVFPGLHAAMQWNGPLMTDSGGFQIFSMGAAREHGTSKVAEPETPAATSGHTNILENVGVSFLGESTGKGIVTVTDKGVVFSENGRRQWLDAEKSIHIQEQLGADIIFAFDEPTSPRHDYAYTKQSLTRTHGWAARSLVARKSTQLLYGIVQGGSFEDLRRESARFIASLPFDGIALGGSYSNSFGSTREQNIREVAWVAPFLPEDKPRHLLGIGLIPDIFAGVSAGIDTFDCVVPTREARHGAIWTERGRIDIKKGAYRDDKTVLDETCACFVCAEMKTEKGTLHLLFKEKNYKAGRLATIHNVSFFNLLMSRIRRAVREGTFSELRARYAP